MFYQNLTEYGQLRFTTQKKNFYSFLRHTVGTESGSLKIHTFHRISGFIYHKITPA